jgi:hypothetical protein
MKWWQTANWVSSLLCDGWAQRWPRAARLAALAAAGFLAVYLLAPVVANNWDLIDDHEIISLLDKSPHHGLRWFFSLLIETEAGKPGLNPRYRPTYYFLRLLETWVYGGHSIVWYGARVAMFGVALTLTLWLLQPVLSLAENLCLIFCFATFPWWIDIWGRLGPAETYAVFGLPLYALGFVRALQATERGELRSRPYVTSGVMLLVGGSICAGTKENFLLLALPSAFVLARAGLPAPRRALAAASLAHVLFCVFVGVSVVIGIHRFGHVYLEDVSPINRAHLLRDWTFRVWADCGKYVLCGLAAVFVTVALLLGRGRKAAARGVALVAVKALLALTLLAAAYLSQVVFYNGAWPPALGPYCCGRYSFPGMLIPPLTLYVGYWCAVRVAEAAGVPALLVALARLAAVAVVAVAIHGQGFPIRQQAAPLVARRAVFQRNLDSIVRSSKANPGQPIILVVNAPGDYEPVVSVALFLNHYHVDGPIYLAAHLPSPTAFPAGSMLRSLIEGINQMSKNGRPPRIEPWVYPSGPCLGVGFHGGLGDLPCRPVASFF